MNDNELNELVDSIPGSDGWWKDASRDVYLTHARFLASVGVSAENILSMLRALYRAAAAEYGD